MEESKKPVDGLKKIKTIFTIEYLVIAVVVLVIAILKLTNVMPNSNTRLLIYNILTSAGGVFILATFILALVKPTYRAKVELLDKSLLAPLALYLLPFDVYCYFHYGTYNDAFVKYSVAGVLLYIFVIYTFLGIYHYFKPAKEVLAAYEEMKKEQEAEKERLEAEQKALENKEATENITNEEKPNEQKIQE